MSLFQEIFSILNRRIDLKPSQTFAVVFFFLLFNGKTYGQQDCMTRKIIISVDSICAPKNVQDTSILNRDGFPDTNLEVTLLNITKYISNYIKSFSTEYGYSYHANYLKSKKVDSDITIKILLKEEPLHSPVPSSEKASYFRLGIYLIYNHTLNKSEQIGAIAIGSPNKSFESYHELLKESRFFLHRTVNRLFHPLVNYTPARNHTRSKRIGINTIFQGTTAHHLKECLTQITAQKIIIAIERSLYTNASDYMFVSNYRVDTKVQVDYKIAGFLKEGTEGKLYLILDWIEELSGHVIHSKTIELSYSLIEDGNYMELMLQGVTDGGLSFLK